MKTRILASTMLIPFFVCVFFGGVALKIAVVLLAAVGLDEFYKAMEHAGHKPSRVIGFGSLAVLAIGHVILNGFNPVFVMFWVIAVLMLSLVYGFDIDGTGITDSFGTLFGVLYVVLLFYQLVLIDESSRPVFIWLVFLTAYGADTMAYFTGYAIGKHKLCPKLSPKKTVEGAIGGVLGSVIFNMIFCLVVLKEFPWYIIVFSVAGAVLSQIGDLAASSIKRKVDIKDYGKIMPGHGGVLDRFDSVIFVAPALYLLMQFI
ncbi:MAG: phosphatidate cytidylyltransferase [Clostridia bacterium]|nr:phosphatidate cytidylyltransferase [Clostridia bacterium]